ncbi:4-hydroxy-3-methylbut-2-enyl diphosphate reductase [Candidatus Gracilibacteria bacterium]|nr:4-hydroxy-3-methylbut-2-enyl diphosphate reductase [Candidatus Gracilibacteria bacterium]
MKIIRADPAGFCFGVQRAYELARNFRGKKIQTLGELIHNPEVLEELNACGVRAVSAISKIRTGVVIIRAHGISEKKMCELKKKKVKVVDASCPFVKKIHAEIKKFTSKKIPILVIGQRRHPEMQAVIEDFPEVEVIQKISEKRLQKFTGKKVALLSQTTEQAEKFERVLKILKKLKVHVTPKDTICSATRERQAAAASLAKKVDLMIVIGGRRSNNTRQLFEIVRQIRSAFLIENKNEIQKKWFTKIHTVGVTAGASTPEKVIAQVCEKLKNL